MAEVDIRQEVSVVLSSAINHLVQVLGENTEALCTALALLAASAEAELKARLPLDKPVLVCNTRALIENMADRMNRQVLGTGLERSHE